MLISTVNFSRSSDDEHPPIVFSCCCRSFCYQRPLTHLRQFSPSCSSKSLPSTPCFNLAVWHRKMLSLRPWRWGPGACTVSPFPAHHPDAAALRLPDINTTTSDMVQDEWERTKKANTSPIRTQQAQQLQCLFMQKCVKCSHERGEVAEMKNWKTIAENILALHKKKKKNGNSLSVLSISISFV